ncbi:MBL fold metallo-hydrolase [Paenibacillus sp. CMAA1739]|uniref:MBL fold metallo-hydrolase n=1 Tax=Paenibacillus ottowii TaxID=2315729 RepID=UPI002731E4FC|nr:MULTISPECIES: MBL fold metallo-hydrolase [Paenibacillus]MDP1511430.1 MBL fold metallo-hydrolase [Paenibacillus ottowii]MEC4568476.1 MBL fold metallo-hydrolase [Paenibacillus sp. CMAA1739]
MKLPELTPCERIDGGFQVKISMSFPLRWVNSYVLKGQYGFTIVDPGPRNLDTEAEWAYVFQQLGMSFEDISDIVVTHHHPDHYGLAGWMQQQGQARVHMSARSHKEAMMMWADPESTTAMEKRLPSFFVQHGFPLEQVSALEVHMQQAYLQVNPQPEITFIPVGINTRLEWAGRSWMPVETGGHAPGHVSLYEPNSGVILCGDAVLPQISPNISLLPGSDAQPLKSYIDGLQCLGELEVAWAYPGHRNPFGYFRERTQALLAHHEERLEKFQQLIQPGGSTAYELCIAVFGEKLGIHQLRFAMSETLAHLVELVRRERAFMSEESPITRFYPHAS